ncbi:2TM domain-containing protein [Robiginitalea sp. IMCC43444]|uniref:2TM domain-containing protein n=1 Tax=Robiginitalea sp. IMCC43444 TaxID=3459121 RepID=UPI0040417ED8
MKTVIKEFGRATLIGILLFLLFTGIRFFNGYQITFDTELWKDFSRHMVFGWIIYMANFYVFRFQFIKWGPAMFHWKRLAYAISLHTLVSLVAVFIARYLIISVSLGVGFQEFIAQEVPEYYYNSIFLALIIAGIFYTFFYYKHRQEYRVKEQKIIAGTASAQFDALKNQLDPHFLFNSLNVLTSLIEEDPEQAQRFTTALSKVYRYVLEQKNKELVPVDEEYAFANTYIKLLKMRFEDSIVFEIPEQCSDPQAKIVPLSLQLLLENAVKHNVVNAGNPLRIVVSEADGFIVVSNNLQEKQVVSKSSGVGLQNILQRYSLLSEREPHIRKTTDTFSVAIPMLTRQVSVQQTQEDFISDKRYEKARERVEAIKEFYSNLGSYMLVIPFLFWLNSRTTDFLWAVFPALGWGFGLVMHGMKAYGYNPLWGKRWEERKIQELMDREDF